MRLVCGRIELRQRFLRGELDAREVAVQERILSLDADVERTHQSLARLHGKLEYVRLLAGAGHVLAGALRDLETPLAAEKRVLSMLELEREGWMQESGR